MQSEKIRKSYLALATSALLVTACTTQDIDWKGMELAQKEFNERQRKEVVVLMSLETMFPDKRVRDLARAAGKGRVKEVEKLVAEGVDVNSRGTSNATPLFWAMKNLKGFEKLLELGADPNVIYDDGGSVITWAVRHKDERFLIAALKHGGDPNLVTGLFTGPPLFYAAGPGGKSKAGILLDAGADINAQRSSGTTPLMVAAGLGQFDLVYQLLERGADFTMKDNNGRDLVDVIEFRKGTMDPKNELTRWMEKVIEWLKARGVTFPDD